MDRRQHRGRGPPAGVQLDQGVRPALQRQVPRRQVLPLAGGDRRRGVPAGDGRPRRQAQGHQLLRPLQPRLGDPRDRRPAAARLPDALVQQRRLQALGQIGRPCLLGYIDKCSAPCVGNISAEDHRAIVDDFCDFIGGNTNAFVKRIRTRDVRRLRGARLREGRPAPRRPRRAREGAGEAGRRLRRRHRRRRDRPGRGPARGRRADLLRARRPDPRPARLGRRSRRGGRHGRAGRGLPPPALRRRRRRRDPARDPGARSCRPSRRRWRRCSATCGGAG